VDVAGKKEILFQKVIPLKGNHVEFIAQDRLGNKTIAEIGLDELAMSSQPLLIADAGSSAKYLALVSGQKARAMPLIKIKDWADSQTVFLDMVYIEGQAVDNDNIVFLSINNEEILPRNGKRIYFSHLVFLDEGKNTITIKAQDAKGNNVEKKIEITRVVPQAFQFKERMSVSILPFVQNNAMSQISKAFQSQFTDALVNRDRFNVVERELLDAVLQEQKLSQTDLIDRKTAIKVGNLIAAHAIVTGDIIETKLGREIIARVIDTETGRILAAKDVYSENKSVRGMDFLSEAMAVRLHNEFPVLNGIVIKIQEKKLFIDLGANQIKNERRLIVYRETKPIKHPVTGKLLGSDKVIIGKIRVAQVNADFSKADISGDCQQEIHTLDGVITQ